MVLAGLKSVDEKSQNQTLKFEVGTSLDCSQLETMTARRHPVTLPGDTEDTDTREKIWIRIRPGEDVEVTLTRRIRYGCNFNYRLGAVE